MSMESLKRKAQDDWIIVGYNYCVEGNDNIDHLKNLLAHHDWKRSQVTAKDVFVAICGICESCRDNSKELPSIVLTAVEKICVDFPFLVSERRGSNLSSLLHDFVSFGRLDALDILLNIPKVDIDVRDGSLRTPLTLVCSTHQRLDMAISLLNKGADALARDEHSKSSLHYAAKSVNKPLFEMLCNSLPLGRSLPTSVLLSACDCSLAELSLLNELSRYDFVKSLLISGQFSINSADGSGDTMLIYCCRHSFENLVILAIEMGADPEILNYKGETALHLSAGKRWWSQISAASTKKLWDAISDNNATEVKRLVKVGVNLNECNELGVYPLSEAVHNSSDSMVEVMLACDADVNADPLLPALLRAALFGFTNKLVMIVNAGAKLEATDCDRNNCLHLLAREGHATGLRAGLDYIMKTSVPVILSLCDAFNSDGMTPIMCAANNNHIECVELLSAAGSEPQLDKFIPNLHKMDITLDTVVPPAHVLIETALHRTRLERFYFACKFGFTALVVFDLRNSRDIQESVNTSVQSIDYVTIKDKMTRVSLNDTYLYTACYHGHTAIVKELLQYQADPNILAGSGWSCLYAAAKKGCYEIVQMLIAHGAFVNSMTRNNLTPLNIAAYGGYLDIVKLLVEHGADLMQGDKSGAAPLHASVQSGNCELVQYLLDCGADINAVTLNGISCLYVVSYKGNALMVELLLAYKPPPECSHLQIADVNLISGDGLSVLSVAAFHGQVRIVQLLLDAGADVNGRLAGKASPLYVCAQVGHFEVARLLLARGADPNAMISNGSRPVHIAALENRMDILQLLLDYGAEVDIANADCSTPLYMAAERGRVEVVTLLLGLGVNVNAVNKMNVSPLNVAAQNNHVDVVKLLLANGALINSQTEQGFTPLMIATQNGNTEVCRVLLAAGADVEMRSRDKETALLIGAYFQCNDIVKLFIEHKAMLNNFDRDMRTALWWASKAGNAEGVKLLLDAGADASISDREHVTPMMIAAEKQHSKVCELLCIVRHQPTLCSICLTNQRSVLFLPCRHLATCANCYAKMNTRSDFKKCPLCRIDIAEAITVFV